MEMAEDTVPDYAENAATPLSFSLQTVYERIRKST